MSTNSLPLRLACTLGTAFAALHVVWALLVALGWAQSMVNASLRLHMLSTPVRVASFDLVTAISLIVVTGVVGGLVGWFAGMVWEQCPKK